MNIKRQTKLFSVTVEKRDLSDNSNHLFDEYHTHIETEVGVEIRDLIHAIVGQSYESFEYVCHNIYRVVRNETEYTVIIKEV